MNIDNSSGNAILTPGVYWASIAGISTPDSNILVASTSYQPEGFPVFEDNGTIYYLSSTDAAYCNINFGHVASLLYADWTRTPATTPLRQYQPVQFTGSTNGSPNSTYAWTFNDINAGLTLPNQVGKIVKDTVTALVQSIDTINVCLVVTDGGVSSPAVCKYVPVRELGVGINEVSGLSSVTMVPNPTSGRVTISADDVNGALSIIVVNMLGEVVKNYNEQASGTFTKSYNMSDLSTGMYLVKIQNEGNMVTKRLSIAKQ
jgi:hypothetical protein